MTTLYKLHTVSKCGKQTPNSFSTKLVMSPKMKVMEYGFRPHIGKPFALKANMGSKSVIPVGPSSWGRLHSASITSDRFPVNRGMGGQKKRTLDPRKT